MKTPLLNSAISTTILCIPPARLGTRFSAVVLGDLHRTTARMTMGREEEIPHHEFPDRLIPLGIHGIHGLLTRDRIDPFW